jgi:hypothetical protein
MEECFKESVERKIVEVWKNDGNTLLKSNWEVRNMKKDRRQIKEDGRRLQ